MEAFDLAVGLGPVRADESMDSADLGEGFGEAAAFTVGPGVVGHDPLDAVSPPGGGLGGAEMNSVQAAASWESRTSAYAKRLWSSTRAWTYSCPARWRGPAFAFPWARRPPRRGLCPVF